MKKIALLLALTLALGLCACGEEPIDPAYTGSSVVIDSFTEVAGENPDGKKETAEGTCYIYEVKDPKVGAAAYDLYKTYLDENFTYSPTESTVVADGFSAVYHAGDGSTVIYTEAVAKDGSYTISVTVPH